MKKAKVFDTTLEDYLTQVGGIDLLSRADALGATVDDGALIIPFYGTPLRVSEEGVFNASGERANFAVSVVRLPLCVAVPGDDACGRRMGDLPGV